MFLFDITLTFLTGFYDNEGNLILEYREIFIKYIGGWFSLDFVALFPFDQVISYFNNGESQNSN